MLVLEDKLYISSGSARDCFEHPDDPNMCIKVDHPDRGKPVTLNEVEFLERVGKWRNLDRVKALVRFYGRVETDRGLGAQYQLVRDQTTGDVSSTLFGVMHDTSAPYSDAQLNEALENFRNALLDDAIVCKDVEPDNICVQEQKNGDVKMILIDGFGHREFFKFNDRFRFLSRRKLRKYFKRLSLTTISEMRTVYPSNGRLSENKLQD